MNLLKSKNFILYSSPRCAVTSLHEWFKTFRPLKSKIIIVVRNPINRFASTLNHPLIFKYIGNEYSKKRIDMLLTYLEKNGIGVNEHFQLQSDKPASYFTHIIRMEDGNIINKLNQITNSTSEDFLLNSAQDKLDNPDNYDFDYSKIEIITPSDFNDKHLARIRSLYKSDFENFYD